MKNILVLFVMHLYRLFFQPYRYPPLVMMAACAGLTADVGVDCDYPLIGGVNDRLILFNFDDVIGTTRNGTNPQIVESITLASGARGYVYTGKNNSHEPRAALVKLRYAEVYEHEVSFKVFDTSPAVKKELQNMAKTKVIALVQNNFVNATGNSTFELYGLGAGLEQVELERLGADTETQSAWSLVIRTSEFAREAALPNTFFLTNYATTKALVDALIV
jgi:hypothetical protein